MSEVPFIRLIVGALLSATGVDASCPIELSPPSVVVKYGTSVAVSCSTSHPAAEGMGWEVRYGGTNLMKVRNVTWAVENLTDWNIKPMCYVNLPESSDAAVETQCRQILPVTLYKYPKNVTISRPSGLTGPMTEKEEYIFTCVVEDIAPVQNLSVTWYKGNTTVIKTERFIKSEKKPVVQSSVLVFRPSRDDDGVGIRCEAQLNLEPHGPKISVISEEYPLEVHYGPDINCWDIDIPEGENLERKCQVTGNPLPNVAWWKDGKPWDPTVPLVKEDTGIYTIEVQGNTVNRTIVPVLVSFAPKLTCQKKLLAVEHSTPDNLYKIESYPDSTITFYKDGEEVSSLDNLTRHDSGQYTIVATNSISNNSCILELHVLYAPSPIVELEDTEIEVGSSGGLKCTSTGNPRPVYTWNYYETPNVKVDNEDGVSRLHVQNATGVNIGSYTCHAWNSLGNISKTVRVTVKDATFQCPIEIIPERMVVAYQDKGSVTCEPNPYPSKNIQEIHWWVTDHVIDDFTWTVDRHEDWDARAFCVATFEGIGTCRKPVDFTLYKMPDSVVIHSVNHDGPMVAGTEYQLRCDVLKVAPVQNLTVRWYQGNESVKNQGTLQVTNCTQPNKVPCDVVGTRGPVNVSSTISVILDRNQSRVEFRCEAELDLNSLGSPLTMASGSLQIAVLYEPVINTTKLRSRVPVFRGYPAELVCEAEGRPPPQVRWISEKGVSVSGGLLTVSEAGVYTCNATNEVASSVLVVEVIFEGEPGSASDPIELSSASVVVKYGDPVSVNCSAAVAESEGMGWEAPYGGQPFQKNAKYVVWSVDSLKIWTIKPMCYITIRDYEQFSLVLPVTIYKTPDSMSISQPDFTGPMVAGRAYRLRCDFTNVAPLRNLSVAWYKGNEVIGNQTYDTHIATPQNDTSFLTITPRKDDNGARIVCRAQLDLGPSGPDPSPVMTSEPYVVDVQYPPAFLSPKPETLDLAVNDEKILNCSAVGNPAPVYSWLASHPTALEVKNEAVFSPPLLLPGTYTCTASNPLGYSVKNFTVTETQSNHPGLTAGIVVAILVVLCLVSVGVVYHRQTKPKPSGSSPKESV